MHNEKTSQIITDGIELGVYFYVRTKIEKIFYGVEMEPHLFLCDCFEMGLIAGLCSAQKSVLTARRVAVVEGATSSQLVVKTN